MGTEALFELIECSSNNIFFDSANGVLSDGFEDGLF